VSTPSQGRGLSFPIVWGADRARAVKVPEISGEPDPDEAVMARLHAKDADALRLLFERYSRLVLGIALRILHDYGEAEEIVQELFFQVYQKSHLFDPLKGTAKAWIVRIALHRALDRKSYLGKRGFYFGTQVGYQDDALLGDTDLDRSLAAKLNRVQLKKAFEELSEMQRRTLELFHFEGLTLREISDKLEEPLGNIRHHYYRGLERLRSSGFIQELRGK
jgi:RNA polymerase sigma-70 factor, ECF subfamily